MELTLVIMAAGMGSRFGGLKQIAAVSPSGESIIDFSVYDAIRSGYKNIIVIVRKEIESDFRQFFGKRLEKHVDIQYVNQKEGSELVAGREKPLGTADAVLAAKHLIRGPFSVINADDFYGLDSFKKGSQFLRSGGASSDHALIGYRLDNTISEYGSVSRAKCEVDDDGMLSSIQELHKITSRNKSLFYEVNGELHPIPGETIVSMNFWCFQPQILPHFQQGFQEFNSILSENPTAEYLIPDVCYNMIKNYAGTFKVIPTNNLWFGITYKEDFSRVSSGISQLIESGEYPSPLWK